MLDKLNKVMKLTLSNFNEAVNQILYHLKHYLSANSFEVAVQIAPYHTTSALHTV